MFQPGRANQKEFRMIILLLAIMLAGSALAAEPPALAQPQVTSHSATISWTASTTPAVTYNVYRSTTSGSYGTRINPNQVTVRTYSDGSVVAGTRYFYVVRSFLASTNLESINSNEVTATIPQDPIPPPPPPPPPQGTTTSLWPLTITPGTVDNVSASPLEVGVKFSSDVAGKITSIRFYKASTNTGIHTASIWSAAGAKLASATFTNETAGGWQTVTLATPLNVTAGTTYTASVWFPKGHFSSDRNYFIAPRVVAPLRTPTNAGVYRYGTASGYPAAYYVASNYWVDVVLDTATTPLPLTVSCPGAAPGITGLRTGDAYSVSVSATGRTANCTGTAP